MSRKLEISSRIGCPGRSCKVASNCYLQLLVLFIASVFNHSTQNTMSRLLKLFSIYSPCFLTCYIRRHRQAATCHKKKKVSRGKDKILPLIERGGRQVACCLYLQTSLIDWRNLLFGISTEFYEWYAANAGFTKTLHFLLLTKRWSFLLD